MNNWFCEIFSNLKYRDIKESDNLKHLYNEFNFIVLEFSLVMQIKNENNNTIPIQHVMANWN